MGGLAKPSQKHHSRPHRGHFKKLCIAILESHHIGRSCLARLLLLQHDNVTYVHCSRASYPLQAPRVLSVVCQAAHGPDRRSPGRARAPLGADTPSLNSAGKPVSSFLTIRHRQAPATCWWIAVSWPRHEDIVYEAHFHAQRLLVPCQARQLIPHRRGQLVHINLPIAVGVGLFAQRLQQGLGEGPVLSVWVFARDLRAVRRGEHGDVGGGERRAQGLGVHIQGFAIATHRPRMAGVQQHEHPRPLR